VGKYADFKRSVEQEDAPPAEYIVDPQDVLQNDPIETGTGGSVIDTRTSRPPNTGIQGYEGAGIGAEFKAGFVDNPEAKIKIYAAARFPDMPEKDRLARYGIRDGEIVFVDTDGRLRLETPDDFTGKAKRFLGETGAAAPEVIGGAVGTAMGGPLGAAVGSAGGEAIRKTIGTQLLGDEQSGLDWTGDIAGAGALGFASDLAGRAVTNRINASKMKTGGALRFGVGKDVTRGYLSPAKQAEAEQIRNLADQAGIKLAPHQLYDKESMTNIWKYLRKHPRTSDAVKQFEDAQADQVEAAMEKRIQSMIRPDDTPYKIGTDLKEAAGKTITDAEASRTAATSDLYRQAFDLHDPNTLDISPVIKDLDEAIAAFPESKTSSGRATIEKVKSLLLKSAKDEDGNVIKVPENDLKRLHNAKLEIDDMLDGTSYEATKIPPSSKKVINRILGRSKDKLLSIIDNANPVYAEARAKYAELSPPIERLKKNIIGELAGLQKEGTISKAAAKVASSGNIPDATLVSYAKSKISDPGVIDRAVGGYIRDTYESLKAGQASGGEIVNVAGKMHQKLFGSQKQRSILKAALKPDQFNALEDLMTVFKRVSIGKGNESMSIPFAAIDQELNGTAGSKLAKIGSAATQPMTFLRNSVFDRWNDIVMSGNQDKIFQALTSKDVTAIIRRMKPLTDDKKKLYRGLSAALTLIAADVGLNEFDRARVQDVEPQTATQE